MLNVGSVATNFRIHWLLRSPQVFVRWPEALTFQFLVYRTTHSFWSSRGFLIMWIPHNEQSNLQALACSVCQQYVIENMQT